MILLRTIECIGSSPNKMSANFKVSLTLLLMYVHIHCQITKQLEKNQRSLTTVIFNTVGRDIHTGHF